MDKETAKRIDEHWPKNSTHSLKTRWLEFPAIHEHVNSLVCGRTVDGLRQGLNHKLKAMGRFFETEFRWDLVMEAKNLSC